VHFWNRDRFRYDWLEGEPVLGRSFLPAELLAEPGAPDALVFVQADCRADESLAEARWVSAMRAEGVPIAGIVAHAALEDDCADHLDDLGETAGVVGVRRLLQDESPGFALSPGFVRGVRLLARHSFSMDLCIREHQLSEVTRLVRLCPDVEFVLDHLGKPAIGPGGPGAWAADLAELAAEPNVSCKLSGLMGEAPSELRSPAALAPWLEHALEVFGAERCMFGSDWPVLTAFDGYANWLDVVETALAGATTQERAAVRWGTAARVYRS
jgi:L-fuconolactonase